MFATQIVEAPQRSDSALATCGCFLLSTGRSQPSGAWTAEAGALPRAVPEGPGSLELFKGNGESFVFHLLETRSYCPLLVLKGMYWKYVGIPQITLWNGKWFDLTIWLPLAGFRSARKRQPDNRGNVCRRFSVFFRVYRFGASKPYPGRAKRKESTVETLLEVHEGMNLVFKETTPF